MKSVPRILPLVGVAIGGVLAVNALSGAESLPDLVSGAQAFAKEAAGPAAKSAANAKPGEAAATGQATDTAAGLPAPSIAPKPVCAPTAAELARQAGLSPAELQVLQSLGERRGQLDKREDDLSTQLALMAAAEAKLDAKIKSLNELKGQVQGLLNETDAKQAAEIDRLVKVFESMKAKDAAPRFTVLDDSVRLPIAAKMKERSLSAIVAAMPAAEAKKLTEALARRYSDVAAAAKAAANDQPPPAAKAPTRTAAAAPRKKAPASQQAAAKPAAPAAAAPEPAADPAAAPPKSG